MHKLALLTILILGVVAGAPRIAAADKKPLDVASIAPAVAQRGALVTVEGHGFGGPNVRITVGGESVPVIAATGTTATFRVPPLGAVGRVTVRVTNPGGHAGEIGLNVLFDGSVSVQADTAAAVATEIGPDGGSLEAAGMTLAIPAGAVPEGVTITATPLRALAGSPFAGAPVGLQLEPSGLVLLQPATLTLPKPAGPRVVAFGFDGDGENLHLIPHADSGSSLSLQVWHFSGAGATTVSAAELQAVLGYEPTRAHQLAEQRIAAAIDRYADGGPAPAQAIFDALVAWRSSMNNGLEVAMETGRLDFFELAFGEWQAWRAYAQQFRNEMTPEHLSFIDVASRHDRDFATAVAAEIARPLLNRCIGPGIPRPALRDVLRLANAVNLDALPIETFPVDESLPGGTSPNLPSGRNLPTACVDVQITDVEHAAVLARNRDNRFTAQARVVFWKGTPSTTVPLRYRVGDTTNGPLVPLASGMSATGIFEDTISPAAAGLRGLELTADLDSSGTDAVLRTFFDQRSFSVPVRERVELQARRPGDPAFSDSNGSVPAGGRLELRVRLAGDTVAAIPVTLTHDGGGSLPATATTNNQGDVIVTYTAPATVGTSELLTATVTDGAFTTGDGLVVTTREPIAVAVSPSFGFVDAGGTLQFTATVTGTSDQRVSWVAAGGSISASGLYTAGPTAGVFAVRAVSLADPTVSGTASVQVTDDNVEGRYSPGTVCLFNDVGDENCSTGGFILDYHCSWQSNLHAGTTCGWFSGQGFQQVPSSIPLCFFETDGTKAGGAFVGKVTFCRFRPASNYAATRIEGTIGDGRLEFSVFAPGFDGTERLWERISMTKAP